MGGPSRALSSGQGSELIVRGVQAGTREGDAAPEAGLVSAGYRDPILGIGSPAPCEYPFVGAYYIRRLEHSARRRPLIGDARRAASYYVRIAICPERCEQRRVLLVLPDTHTRAACHIGLTALRLYP